MTTVLTVPPLLFGVTALSGPVMSFACRRYATTGERRQVAVPTMASLSPQCLQKGADAIDDLVGQLQDDGVVFAWSQGVMIATTWMLRDKRRQPGPGELRFVFIGNPLRGQNQGGVSGTRWGNVTMPDTPTDTGLPVLDAARWGDKYAQPRGLSDMKARGVHCNYFGVNLTDPKPESSDQVGGTTYLVVP